MFPSFRIIMLLRNIFNCTLLKKITNTIPPISTATGEIDLTSNLKNDEIQDSAVDHLWPDMKKEVIQGPST